MTDEPRIMPPRRFQGSSGNTLVWSLVQDMTASRRPLAEGERYLGRFILPPFQRGLVWTTEQKVRLIESIYMGMPIGALVWNQTVVDGPTDGWLLDGQQRTSAVIGFVKGQFPVRGWRFPDLSDIEKRHFGRMTVSIIETNIADEAMCRDVYDRLVYGGTAHDQ